MAGEPRLRRGSAVQGRGASFAAIHPACRACSCQLLVDVHHLPQQKIIYKMGTPVFTTVDQHHNRQATGRLCIERRGKSDRGLHAEEQPVGQG